MSILSEPSELMRLPDALAVSAPVPDRNVPDVPCSAPRHSGPAARSVATPRKPKAIRPTPRYHQLVDLLFQYRLLTDRQIHLALFPPGNASGCQRTLTLLVRHRWIDHLPRRSVSDPYVYCLTSRSVVGNRLMREKYGEAAFRRQMIRLGPIEHQLAVNDIRVRVEKAAPVDVWQRPDQLTQILGPKLQPDAYFRVTSSSVAGFFLELQRSIRSHRALLSKLERYQTLFASMGFADRRMYVLTVFTTEYGRTAQQRVAYALRHIPAERYPFLRIASLDTINAAANLFTDSIWYQAGSTQPVSLNP